LSHADGGEIRRDAAHEAVPRHVERLQHGQFGQVQLVVDEVVGDVEVHEAAALADVAGASDGVVGEVEPGERRQPREVAERRAG
jgi:hypothetical protein